MPSTSSPRSSGWDEEPPVAGTEFERRATALLDHAQIPGVIGECGPRRQPRVVGEGGDAVVPTVGHLLDELVARPHLAMSTTGDLTCGPTDRSVSE